jgi:hypothetical protein
MFWLSQQCENFACRDLQDPLRIVRVGGVVEARVIEQVDVGVFTASINRCFVPKRL